MPPVPNFWREHLLHEEEVTVQENGMGEQDPAGGLIPPLYFFKPSAGFRFRFRFDSYRSWRISTRSANPIGR